MRQYIGARYVPKFYSNSLGSPEWESGVAYEALTIVTYNGNSYTSKIPVPSSVGNPSSNPNYWASTGIYNQQVEQLRQEVEAVSDEVETKQDDIIERVVQLSQSSTVATIGQINNDDEITADMVCINYEYSNPSAIPQDLTVTTYNGYLVVTGICTSANVTLTLRLCTVKKKI